MSDDYTHPDNQSLHAWMGDEFDRLERDIFTLRGFLQDIQFEVHQFEEVEGHGLDVLDKIHDIASRALKAV